MSGLLDQFRKEWAEKKFIATGDTVLVAVSGGSDSMVLADLFLKSKISFAIAHCNFGLRGHASDLDEQLVRDWCVQHNIRFHNVLFDTKAKSAEWKKGTQETARELRYQWFEQLRQAHGYARIATAHHANDNLETLLINLFRGTGISGLHGIKPVNGKIIRPLLFAPKEAITNYVLSEKVPFREDASNKSDDYLRNAIRHNVIPEVQKLFPGVVANVSESITHFSEGEILYNQAIEKERKTLLEQRGRDWYIPVLKLRHRQPLATIVYELLRPYGFTSSQVPDIIGLLSSQTGHFILSQSHRIIRNRDFLVITTIPSASADLILIESVPCTVNAGSYTYKFSYRDRPDIMPVSKDEAWLDTTSLQFPLILRKWRNGDYLYPLGMKMKKKKVSRLLIDKKISLPGKEEVRILETSKKVAWVSGIRIDERFKIKPSTSQVLVVKRELLNVL